MKLATFQAGHGARVGVVAGDRVIDANLAYRYYLASRGVARAAPHADAEVPADMAALLDEGPDSLRRADEAAAWADEAFGQDALDPEVWRRAPGGGLGGGPPVHRLAEVRLLPVVPRPGKIICLGLNYRDHAAEAGLSVPDAPALFPKFATSLIGAGDPIRLPRVSDQVDYEGELAVIIGKPARYVPRERALDYVAGYTILNDVSVRDYQMRTSQWLAGKAFDRTTPVGPYLVTADAVVDPHNLHLTLELNGRIMQQANTGEMLFPVDRTIAYISEILTLEPGDLIAMGTPSGVGFKRTPPVFLRDGDTVAVEITGLGRLENRVQKEEGS